MYRRTRYKKKTRFAGRAGIARVVQNLMNRKIETKESQQRACSFASKVPFDMYHNNIHVVFNRSSNVALNMFQLSNGETTIE